jgi:tetratricopeptide (TPR) repeat protein
MFDSAFSRARTLIGIATLVSFVAGTASPVTAAAQEKSSEALSEERKTAAKAEFEKGARLYRDERFEDAVSAFLAADQLAPSPALSFNIARAYERLNDVSSALRWYRDYLRRAPAAENAADVQAKVHALDAVLVERGLAEATPEAPREQNPDLRPPEPAAAPAKAPARSTATGESERPLGIAPYVVAGSGAVLLVGALGVELARRGQESKAEDARSQIEFADHVDSMEDMKTTSRILFGLGSVALVTGGVLYFLNERREAPSPVAFGCTPLGCAATARGTF